MQKVKKSTEDSEFSQLAPEVQIEKLRQRHRELFAELEQAQQRLLNSEKIAAVGRVSATIIQDFNDPLQAISNVLGGIYRRGTLDSEDMPLVALAYREVKKLNELVKDLREFYQPIHGKTDLFDVRIELVKIISLNKPRLSDKGIIVTTEFANNIPLIQVVANQIEKVFQELLDNIIVVCGHQDIIHISTYVDKNSLVLQINDSGCGINQSVISPLFAPLHISKSNKPARGSGLATSYAIITMHGGTIETEGDPGISSVFKLKLPIHDRGRTGIEGKV
jgi:signal transduction histidine kinase